MKPFKVVTDALKEAQPDLRGNWRQRLRAKIGDRLEEILLELAEGRAWVPTLPDGQITDPVVPSSDVRLRAALALKELMDGKAVPQTEIVKAEQEAQDLEAVRALSDAELEAEARKILESRRPKALDPGPVTEAVVEETVDIPKIVDQIWNAPNLPEGDE